MSVDLPFVALLRRRWPFLLLAAIFMLDIVGRVWVALPKPPKENSSEQAGFDQSALRVPELSAPYDPFYPGAAVASRINQEQEQADIQAAQESAPVAVAYSYRLLAVSDRGHGEAHAVIQMRQSQGGQPQGRRGSAEQAIETLAVGDTIGDAALIGIASNEARLSSASLGELTLGLFKPSSDAVDKPASRPQL